VAPCVAIHPSVADLIHAKVQKIALFGDLDPHSNEVTSVTIRERARLPALSQPIGYEAGHAPGHHFAVGGPPLSLRPVLPRVLTAFAAASLLAACQGGGAAPPPPPSQLPSSVTHAPQSAARATQHHQERSESSLTASPTSLEFTADQAAAATAQTVTITAKSNDKLAATIAGTGNCPALSPAVLQPKRSDEDGDRDRDHHDAAQAALTVTPAGAGPATCTIAIAAARSGHDEHADGRHHDPDDEDDAGGTLTIAVVVDAPVTPTPAPTSTPR